MATDLDSETRGDQSKQAERVAKALATMSIPELRKLVSEMEAELRKPDLNLVK